MKGDLTPTPLELRFCRTMTKQRFGQRFVVDFWGKDPLYWDKGKLKKWSPARAQGCGDWCKQVRQVVSGVSWEKQRGHILWEKWVISPHCGPRIFQLTFPCHVSLGYLSVLSPEATQYPQGSIPTNPTDFKIAGLSSIGCKNSWNSSSFIFLCSPVCSFFSCPSMWPWLPILHSTCDLLPP